MLDLRMMRPRLRFQSDKDNLVFLLLKAAVQVVSVQQPTAADRCLSGSSL